MTTKELQHEMFPVLTKNFEQWLKDWTDLYKYNPKFPLHTIPKFLYEQNEKSKFRIEDLKIDFEIRPEQFRVVDITFSSEFLKLHYQTESCV